MITKLDSTVPLCPRLQQYIFYVETFPPCFILMPKVCCRWQSCRIFSGLSQLTLDTALSFLAANSIQLSLSFKFLGLKLFINNFLFLSFPTQTLPIVAV
ncbi:hypothetical protein L1887_09026 [Cichorium endivia]|nr:hypothetical protein L1887_09026 [Cichorium endivia]